MPFCGFRGDHFGIQDHASLSGTLEIGEYAESLFLGQIGLPGLKTDRLAGTDARLRPSPDSLSLRAAGLPIDDHRKAGSEVAELCCGRRDAETLGGIRDLRDRPQRHSKACSASPRSRKVQPAPRWSPWLPNRSAGKPRLRSGAEGKARCRTTRRTDQAITPCRMGRVPTLGIVA